MKVEQKEVPAFQPVVITIETRAELYELVKTLESGEGSSGLWDKLSDILAAS